MLIMICAALIHYTIGLQESNMSLIIIIAILTGLVAMCLIVGGLQIISEHKTSDDGTLPAVTHVVNHFGDN
jgi:hypothetical protein